MKPLWNCLIICVLLLASCSEKEPIQLPNILLILADVLGYGDLGCYQSSSLVPTPHLDTLAAQGMRFTRAYCPASVCSPSRYALMTGQYPWRSWKKQGVMSNYEPSMMEDSLITRRKCCTRPDTGQQDLVSGI